MSTVPTWAVYLLAFGSPVLAFVGVVYGPMITRKGDAELETRSRREEVMVDLRWAAELAVDADEGRARLGFSQLNALADSDLLDASQQVFIDAALAAIVERPVEEIEQAGGAAQVVQVSAVASGRADVPYGERVPDDEGPG